MNGEEIKCPRCGKNTLYIYRGQRSGDFKGCEHCMELLDRNYAPMDAKWYPKDYEPPKIRCPVCGEFCRTVYRKADNGGFIGCNECVIELNTKSDADANPADYGLPDDAESWRANYKAETQRLREYICARLREAKSE